MSTYGLQPLFSLKSKFGLAIPPKKEKNQNNDVGSNFQSLNQIVEQLSLSLPFAFIAFRRKEGNWNGCNKKIRLNKKHLIQ